MSQSINIHTAVAERPSKESKTDSKDSKSLYESSYETSLLGEEGEKFAHFFDDKVVNEDSSDEQSIEEIEDSSVGKIVVKTVTVRRSLKKKEVTYESENDSVNKISNLELERSKSDIEEEEEYVWVEEEVEEEIEVETSEEDVEIEEEMTEEEGEEKYLDEIRKEIERVEEDENVDELDVIADVVEEKDFYRETEEGIEDVEEMEDLYKEEEIEEKEKEEKREEQDITEVQLEEIEAAEEEEFKEGEEEIIDELGEEGFGEEEEGVIRKMKPKLKTIKLIRMVRKLKKDVINDLKEKAKKVDLEEELTEELLVRKESVDKVTDKEKADRDALIETMKTLTNELMFIKRKNRALSKGIAEYYKTKKGDNVIEIEPPSNEALRKYYKVLDVLKNLQIAVASEIEQLSEEVDGMKTELTNVSKMYEDERKELFQWEEAIAKLVVKSQTGKPLEESEIAHLLQRHEMILDQLNSEQLVFLTLQHQIELKEKALKELISLEGKLSLIDYEQLRMDNQIFSDKIEERDNELAHLRNKVLEIIHIYSHVLEKTAAVIESIESTSFKDYKTNSETVDIREIVTKLKILRDNLRGETSKMKKGAGLLIRPKLALDYEESVRKGDFARVKVQKLIKTYKKQKTIIENLRKEITDATTFHDLF